MQSKTKSESHGESVRLGQARVEPENELCFSLDWGSKRKILLRGRFIMLHHLRMYTFVCFFGFLSFDYT